MAFQSKNGQSFTNRSAMMRHDRIHDAANTQTGNMHQQMNEGPEEHKSVTIHHDGQKFHVHSEGHEPQEHADIESALHHAKQIFGGHSGSDDAAMAAEPDT